MKVLIIDDEDTVREGLRTIIDWASCGFAICGEGTDGEEGLDKILQHNPELTLLDIKMPTLDGIEVAERARTAGYAGKIIIISGYSDFKYAQSAIRHGVNAYLLKPIEESELTDVVNQAKTEIEMAAETAAKERESLRIVRQNYLSDILQGKDVSRHQGMTRGGFSPNCGSYQVAMIEFGGKETSGDYIADAFQGFITENRIDCIFIEGRWVMLLCGPDCIARFLRTANRNVSKSNDQKIFVSLGRVVNSFEEIGVSYKDACDLISRRFFSPKGEAIASHAASGEDRQALAAENSIKIDEYLDKIYFCIEVGETGKILGFLDEIENFYRCSAITPGKVIGILANFCYETLKRIQVRNSRPNRKILSFAEISSKFNEMNSLYDIVSWLRKEFCGMSASISNDSHDDVVAKILNYIEEYSDINIRLESLASIYGYNSTYLGRLFKNTVGENFVSYLDKARINRAKYLLDHTDLKVYEIAVKVGYASLDYFYIKFKRHTGMNPKEYRKR